MTEPTFDASQYPTEETLKAIAEWPADDLAGLFNFVIEAWSHYGRVRRHQCHISFVTGGWGGNEDLIRALEENMTAMTLTWVSSHRGGRHEFEVNK